MYASVALLSPPYACLTYALPPEFPSEFWRPGLRLAVPLGRGEQGALRAAVLLAVSLTSGLPDNVACKAVCWPLEDAPLLDSHKVSQYASVTEFLDSNAAQSAERKLERARKAVKSQLATKLDDVEVRYEYTTVFNGLSVEADYADQIAAGTF